MQKSILSVQYLYPEHNNSFENQVVSLFAQLKPLINEYFPIKLTFFAMVSSKSEYQEKLTIIQNEKQINNIVSPVSLVCQSPACNKKLVLELCLIQISNDIFEIIYEDDFLLLKNNETEILFANTLSYKHSEFEHNVSEAFDNLNRIFEKRKFQYSDVVRQWNYIQDILKLTPQSDSLKQHYQVFNDYRSINYQTSNFKEGYPVATGIGVDQGACGIEVIAIKGVGFNIIPIHNSRQVDAHCYSDHVLVGMPIEKLKKNSSPKFERAKLFESEFINMLLVSGTASIIGEETVFLNDVEGQTQTTIDNIELLLNQAKSTKWKSFKILNYRVYLKNQSDYEKVRDICEEKYGNAPGIIVISDICRNNLLVEIECNYIFE